MLTGEANTPNNQMTRVFKLCTRVTLIQPMEAKLVDSTPFRIRDHMEGAWLHSWAPYTPPRCAYWSKCITNAMLTA